MSVRPPGVPDLSEIFVCNKEKVKTTPNKKWQHNVFIPTLDKRVLFSSLDGYEFSLDIYSIQTIIKIYNHELFYNSLLQDAKNIIKAIFF